MFDAVNPEIINKNLEHMKQQAHKKQLAQAIYYGQNGQSPLTRTLDSDGSAKQPVHQRLGLPQFRKRRVPIHGTNTSSVLPKRRQLFKQMPLNSNRLRIGGPQNRIQKRSRIYLTQNQLFRSQKGVYTNNFRGQFNQPFQKIRLFRSGYVPNVMNYQVQVKNGNVPIKHSIKEQLTSRIQQEIRIIQQQRKPQQNEIENYDFDIPLFVAATRIFLNERFSQLD